MKANCFLKLMVGATASIGLVGFVFANPDNSKPLSGLEGRVFAV